MAGYKRPQPKGGSRKGIPNRIAAELKDMVLQALDNAGGVEYLTRQAAENPAAFLSLVKAVMPKNIRADVNEDRTLTVIHRVVNGSNGAAAQKIAKLLEAPGGPARLTAD